MTQKQLTIFEQKALLRKQHEQKKLSETAKLNQIKQVLAFKVSQVQQSKATIQKLITTILDQEKNIRSIGQERSQATKLLEKLKTNKDERQRDLLNAGQEKKTLSEKLKAQQLELKKFHEQFPQNKSVEMSPELQNKFLKINRFPEVIKQTAAAIQAKEKLISRLTQQIVAKSTQIFQILKNINDSVARQKGIVENIKEINLNLSKNQQSLKKLQENLNQKRRQLQNFQEQVKKNELQRQDTLSYLPLPSKDEVVYISNQGLKWISNNFDPKNPSKYHFWTSDYKVQMPIYLKKSGIGSRKPQTIIEFFRQTVRKYGDQNALTFEVSDNVWKSITYTEYYNQCYKFAKACISLELSFYSAVMIIGFNSPEWAISFYGSIFGYFLPVGMYTTNSSETCEYIANHCEGQLVIVQDKIQLSKYYAILVNCPKIKYFVIYKQSVPTDLPDNLKGKVFTWKQFLQRGEKFIPSKAEDTVEYRFNNTKPGGCACFIYTSGTTGMPKAVMMSHDNLTFQMEGVGQRLLSGTKFGNGNGRILSYLPLSHLAALLQDLIGGLKYGANIFFPHPSVLQNNMLKYLLASRPTIFMGVPRVWEKLEEKLAEAITNTTGIKKKLLDWAMSKGIQGTFAQIHNKDTPSGWFLAKRLYNKIKSSLGLEDCELMIFGAAPMKQSTRKFFLQLNFPLTQAYGMSQTAGVTNLSNKMLWTEFSEDYLKEAGTPVADQQIIIQNQNHQGVGEICIRGRLRFMGYYKNDQANKATIDKKGFVHSGDQGKIDKRGNIYITGRIKELIITAGGENIPPILIQSQILTALPIISQVVALGDKRKYLTCLICLKTKNVTQLADQVIQYIRKRGSNAKTIKQAIACPKFNEIIKKGIQQANKKAISNAQKVQKYTILPFQFTIESGILTPTMKLKRNIIHEKFKPEIDAMYLDSKL